MKKYLFNNPRKVNSAYTGTDLSKDFDMWRTYSAHVTDESLVINGHSIMEKWESVYMQHLVDVATKKGGTILEIGFGLGISAGYIQSKEVSTHIIIEPNQDVFVELIKFTHNATVPIVPYLGFWQQVTSHLESESVDGILFHIFPFIGKVFDYFEFFSEAYRLLKPGGMFTYYSYESDNLPEIHIKELKRSGFNGIKYSLCRVSPPKKCLYWKKSTMVIPIIEK